MSAMLFSHPSMPSHWIVRHEDILYLVPDIPGGWRQRRPYRGYKVSLKAVPPNQTRIFLAHLGAADA
jgi:hypothetical protein